MSSFFLKIIKDEKGQILPWMVFLMALFIGIAGLTIDLGHAFVCYRELQASTDAAALAGAQAMGVSGATMTGACPSTTSVNCAVSSYSSVLNGGSFTSQGKAVTVSANGYNATTNLPNPSLTVSVQCNSTAEVSNISCIGPGGTNVIQVTQSASIPTYFIKALALFNVKAANTVSLSTVSTASMRGATNTQYNLAIVIDTTESMQDQDTDAECSGLKNNSREGCALNGVQQLLKGLKPCISATNCATTQFDTVSMFVFPNLSTAEVADDTNCPTKSLGTPPAYSTPLKTNSTTYTPPGSTSPTYQVTGFEYNYLTNNQNGTGDSVNTSTSGNPIGAIVGTCGGNGVQDPGGDGTYLPGAIYQAGAALAAAGYSNAGSKNALIIVSDGDSGSSTTKITPTNGLTLNNTGTKAGTYPSTIDQCAQGVTAANWVSNNVPNTTVYTIAFGSPSSGCATDTSGITPCQAMSQMATGYESATESPNFYSDSSATQGGRNGGCTAPNNSGFTTLIQIFNALTAQFTKAHLISNSVWKG
jgi:hypothetical protein